MLGKVLQGRLGHTPGRDKLLQGFFAVSLLLVYPLGLGSDCIIRHFDSVVGHRPVDHDETLDLGREELGELLLGDGSAFHLQQTFDVVDCYLDTVDSGSHGSGATACGDRQRE